MVLLIDPAKEMLEVLRSIKEGLPWKNRALSLLECRGYRYMLFHSNLSRRELVETLESLSYGSKPAVETSKWFRKQLSDYVDRLDDISTFLDELESRKDEIVSEAYGKARRYLPESTRIEADIHLVIGGADAYGVNLLDTRAIVMDVGQFLSHLDEIVAMMAHEIHHKAENRSREIYWRLRKDGPKDLGRVYSVISELIGEGVASLATFPSGFAHKYSALEARINEEYEKVEDGIQRVCQDITDERAEDIFKALYANAGPLYMVGCDMAKRIEDAFGRRELIATIQEPMLFFNTYRNAVGRSGEGYTFSRDTMKIIRKLQREIDNM